MVSRKQPGGLLMIVGKILMYSSAVFGVYQAHCSLVARSNLKTAREVAAQHADRNFNLTPYEDSCDANSYRSIGCGIVGAAGVWVYGTGHARRKRAS